MSERAAATPFTSDLSIDEALLVEEAGFEPLEIVVGTCHFHIGSQLTGWTSSQEQTTLTKATQIARKSAMVRLLHEAQAVDADGVVGVRLDVSHHGHHAEFAVVGTAVKRRGAADPADRVNGAPFTSDLSGQDFYALGRSGFRPRALVMGNCVWHVAHQGLGQFFSSIGKNQEMTNFTQALYEARELAMERMQTEAKAAGATGVVGVSLREGRYGWQSHVIEFFAIGTAIAPIAGVTDARPPVATVVSMEG